MIFFYNLCCVFDNKIIKKVRWDEFMDNELQEKINSIAEMVTGLKYYQWRRMVVAIEKKFASESNRVVLSDDTKAIANAIRIEF